MFCGAAKLLTAVYNDLIGQKEVYDITGMVHNIAM